MVRGAFLGIALLALGGAALADERAAAPIACDKIDRLEYDVLTAGPPTVHSRMVVHDDGVVERRTTFGFAFSTQFVKLPSYRAQDLFKSVCTGYSEHYAAPPASCEEGLTFIKMYDGTKLLGTAAAHCNPTMRDAVRALDRFADDYLPPAL